MARNEVQKLGKGRIDKHMPCEDLGLYPKSNILLFFE